jgi:CRP-like cAMP-binding protein
MLSEADAATVGQLLAGTPLAAGARERGFLQAFVRRAVTPGQVLFLEGETGGMFTLIGEGSMRASRQLGGGRELHVFTLTRGHFFGFLPLLDGGPFPVSLVAQTESIVFTLARAPFETLIAENGHFCRQLLFHLAQLFRGCLDQLGTLGTPGALPRLATALASFLPSDAADPVMLQWPMSQIELAHGLGIAPENLSRALTRLERVGILRRERGRNLTILDPERLRGAAEGRLPELDDRQ